MKAIIFDSSTIINFALNGILETLSKLKKNFSGKFIITSSVKNESIERPLTTIKRFELEALQIKNLVEQKVFEFPESLGIGSEEVKAKTRQILDETNHMFSAKNNFIHIIDEGEASCLALSLLCDEKDIENAIAVDERTTRLLCENPENLKRILEEKLHTRVEVKKEKTEFLGIRCLRSSELVYVAYKNGLININDNRILDALLYATKFKGNSISREEIEEIKKLH